MVLISNAAQAVTLGAEKDFLQEQILAQTTGGEMPIMQETTTVKLPALKSKMAAGDVITASDIIYIDLEERKVQRGYIVATKELIGKSPANVIFANRAIMPRQIEAQILVQEKKAVTIFFKNKAIEMQDTGVALEDGAMGDFIRVRNSTSNIVINGKVVAENLVEVAPQRAILARN